MQPQPQPPAASADDRVGWPQLGLAALGLTSLGVAALAGATWRRRRRRRLPAPDPAPLAAALAPRPAPVPPAARTVAEPFAIEIATARIAFLAEGIAFDVEIDLVNARDQTAEGLRPALALISAGPDQDRWRAAFHGGPPTQHQGAPVDLAAGGKLRLPTRLTLSRAQLHVVTHGGRPLFVAMLLCDLRWRGGLSLHRFGADFLLGTAGQGARPGPIWLDRSAPPALAAIRYTPPST